MVKVDKVDKKVKRKSFKEIYGYERDAETPEQTIKRLMTRRLKTFKKAGKALENLAKSPYKASEEQKIYAGNFVVDVANKIVEAMDTATGVEDSIEVPE